MYHGTYNHKLNTPGQVNANGTFGSFLFFSSEPAGFGEVTFELDVDLLDIARTFDIKYTDNYEAIADIVSTLADRLEINEDDAFELIVEDEQWVNVAPSFDAYDQFAIQHASALCAKALGFDGVELTDENGGIVMVDMLGREHMLVRV